MSKSKGNVVAPDEMIDKYGATWIDRALRERIVDDLVEHYGTERSRR